MVAFKTKDGKVITFNTKKEQEKPSGILGYKTKGANDVKTNN